MSVRAGYTRFIIIWTIYSILNGFIVFRALESPMKSSTPRLVYWWYQKVYDVSYFFGMIAYCILLATFFHFTMLFGYSDKEEAELFVQGGLLMFYCVYFGTLSRDFVDRLSDKMATTMGYYSKQGFPKKHLREDTCAICGVTTANTSLQDDNDIKTKIHVLNCNHKFHEVCIKGWTIVGKKDVCPYCKEKVDLNQFKTNSWDTTQKLYLNLLDMVRYILVWNPVVFVLADVVIKFLKLE